MRLHDPEGERVTIDGEDVRAFTLRSLRAQVGYVPQETLILHGSLAENIALGAGREVTAAEVEAAARLTNAHGFIAALPDGFASAVGERGATLSPGQRQRLAIARVARRDCPTLVLDEPTVGLDRANEATVIEAIERLTAGRTSFTVTHDLDLAARADLIAFLDDGVVAEAGTHRDLLARTMGAAGAALARLHRAGPPPGRPVGVEDEADELAAAVLAMTVLLPDLGARAGALAAAVERALGAHDRRPTLIHGDFSADQVILGPSGPVLIDWDRAAPGDPARDLGSFLARLDVQAADGEQSADAAARARRALLAGHRGEASLPPGLEAQRARALLALAPEGFRQRRADWPERAAAILDRVEALLPVPIPSASGAAGGDALSPLLRRARDPNEAGPLVADAAGRPGGAVTEATLLRRKPGQRALVRYVLQGLDGPVAVLGKVRAKGPDRRTPGLHAALRAAGLDAAEPHRVGVPRALGVVDGLHLRLQEEVPGLRATAHLRPGGEGTAAARAGAALARLHACPVEASRRWTLADEVAALGRSLSDAAAALPSAAARVEALASSATILAASLGTELGPGPETGIHRDWYPDQVLLDGGTAWILDLDLHARGDPAIDLGNFVAHVTELSIRRHGDAQALSGHEGAFLDGYAAAGGRPQAGRVAVMTALSLARLVGVSLRIPDRRPATADVIEAAERHVAEAARGLGRATRGGDLKAS